MINANTTTSDTVKKAMAIINEKKLRDKALTLANVEAERFVERFVEATRAIVEKLESMVKTGELTEEQVKQIIANITKE